MVHLFKVRFYHSHKYMTSSIIDGYSGYLQIWPRTFATGTPQKPWWSSCDVHDLRRDCAGPIGILDPFFLPHPHDIRRCTGKKGAVWKPYAQSRLETGEVYYAVRGKEWAMAAGQVSVIVDNPSEQALSDLSANRILSRFTLAWRGT